MGWCLPKCGAGSWSAAPGNPLSLGEPAIKGFLSQLHKATPPLQFSYLLLTELTAQGTRMIHRGG